MLETNLWWKVKIKTLKISKQYIKIENSASLKKKKKKKKTKKKNIKNNLEINI